MPPDIGDPGTTVYTASHNLIKGHAKAYHVYNNEFRKTQKGTLFTVEIIPSLLLLHFNIMFIGKKILKIPKGQSESVYRRTDKTMPNEKVQKDKQRFLQNIHIKVKIK